MFGNVGTFFIYLEVLVVVDELTLLSCLHMKPNLIFASFSVSSV